MLCYRSTLSLPHYRLSHQCQLLCSEVLCVQAWWLATWVHPYALCRFTNGFHSLPLAQCHPVSLVLDSAFLCESVIRSPRWITLRWKIEAMNTTIVRWHWQTVAWSCSKAGVGCNSHCMFSYPFAYFSTVFYSSTRCHCFARLGNFRTSEQVIVYFRRYCSEVIQ